MRRSTARSSICRSNDQSLPKERSGGKHRIAFLLAAPDWDLQPGDEFMALWGTGYDEGRAFVEIEQRNKIIRRFWTEPGRTQQPIKLAVTEMMRGYQSRVETLPLGEKEYSDLLRDRDIAKEKYVDLDAKLQKAQIAHVATYSRPVQSSAS